MHRFRPFDQDNFRRGVPPPTLPGGSGNAFFLAMSVRIGRRRRASKRRFAPTKGGGSTRTVWRLVASVAAVLVLPATAPGTGALACLHHAEHGGAAAGHDARHDAGPVGHDAHPMHEGGRHGSGNGSAEADQDEHTGGQSCTCAGWCPASGGPPSPEANEGRGRNLAWTSVMRVAAPADGPLQPRFVPHLLPFANPPPSS